MSTGALRHEGDSCSQRFLIVVLNGIVLDLTGVMNILSLSSLVHLIYVLSLALLTARVYRARIAIEMMDDLLLLLLLSASRLKLYLLLVVLVGRALRKRLLAKRLHHIAAA